MGMAPRFQVRKRRSGTNPPPKKPFDQNHALVKARPPHWEERYHVAQSAQDVDAQFQQLKSVLFAQCDHISEQARRNRGGKMIHREQGQTADGRPFIFLKPFNDFGWLIERSGAGWRISRAEKIISQQMFLRSNTDPWDIVMLFEDPVGEGAPRLKSQRFGNALMSPVVYEHHMAKSFILELIGETPGH